MTNKFVRVVLYERGRRICTTDSIERMAEYCALNQVPLLYPVDFDLMVSTDWLWKCVVEYNGKEVDKARRSSSAEEWMELDKNMYDRPYGSGMKGIEHINHYLQHFLCAENDIGRRVNDALRDIGFNVGADWKVTSYVRIQPRGLI